MAWLYLVIAGLFETVWAVGLKYTDGFSRLGPSVLVIVAMAISVGLLSFAMKTLPLGTAYAIWTGIGTLGAVIYGILVWDEPATAVRLLFIAMILGGLIGLKAVASHA